MQGYGAVGHVYGWLEAAFLGLSIVLAVAILLLWAITVACRKRALLLQSLTGPISIIFGCAPYAAACTAASTFQCLTPSTMPIGVAGLLVFTANMYSAEHTGASSASASSCWCATQGWLDMSYAGWSCLQSPQSSTFCWQWACTRGCSSSWERG